MGTGCTGAGEPVTPPFFSGCCVRPLAGVEAWVLICVGLFLSLFGAQRARRRNMCLCLHPVFLQSAVWGEGVV